MPLDILFDYQKAMVKLESAEALASIRFSSYPHLGKNEDRKKIIKMYSDNIKEKAVTGLEMARKLSQWQTKK